MKIYVAGPLGAKKNWPENVERATAAGIALAEAGLSPFVPHLMVAFDAAGSSCDYEDYMRIDMEFLEACDVLLRLPGESPGADREVARAMERRIPVTHSVAECIKRFT